MGSEMDESNKGMLVVSSSGPGASSCAGNLLLRVAGSWECVPRRLTAIWTYFSCSFSSKKWERTVRVLIDRGPLFYLLSFCSHQSFLPWPCRAGRLQSLVLKFVCLHVCFYRRGLKYLFLPADIKTTSFVLWKNSLSAVRVWDRSLSL